MDEVEWLARRMADRDDGPPWSAFLGEAGRLLAEIRRRQVRGGMSVTMSCEARGTCPVDGSPDVYRIRALFPPGRTCMVEELREAVDRLLERPILQEDFTCRLADHLACRVETEVAHANGVLLICAAEPRD